MNVSSEKIAIPTKNLKRFTGTIKRANLSKSIGKILKEHRSVLKKLPSTLKRKDGVGVALKELQGSHRKLLNVNQKLLKQKPSAWNVPGRFIRRRQLSKTKSMLSRIKETKGELLSTGKIKRVGLLNTPAKKNLAMAGGAAGLYGAGVVSGSQKNKMDRRYDKYYN